MLILFIFFTYCTISFAFRQGCICAGPADDRFPKIWGDPLDFLNKAYYNPTYKQQNIISMIGAIIQPAVLDGGKRETGENPVRSRHCDWGEDAGRARAATERSGRRHLFDDPSARKPAKHEGTGIVNYLATRNWSYWKQQDRCFSMTEKAFPQNGKAFYFGIGQINRLRSLVLPLYR